MKRRVDLLWIPLLAVLLAGPAGRKPPVWTQESVVGTIDATREVMGLVRPVVDHQLARQPTPLTDRHTGQPWASPPSVAPRVAAPIVPPVSPRAASAPLTETARHFPLLPTGPPSRG